MRACAACRERHPAEKLLRFVRSGTRASADPLRIASGRGLNLHPRIQCLELAIKKRAFQRGLGVQAGEDFTQACERLVEDLQFVSLQCLRSELGLQRVPMSLDQASPQERRTFLRGFGADELSSKKRRERYEWLRQCIDEFTLTPANDRSHAFASGDAV